MRRLLVVAIVVSSVPAFKPRLEIGVLHASPNEQKSPSDGSNRSQQIVPYLPTSTGGEPPSTGPNQNSSVADSRPSLETLPDDTDESSKDSMKVRAGPIPSPSGPLRTLPFYISDAEIAARAAAVCDITRMNPAASGHFYTSAIPVKGDSFFGSEERAVMQGSGSGVGMDFGIRDTEFTGHVFAQAVSLTSDPNQQQFGLVHAYGQWKDLRFGVTDSAFTDPNTMPDMFDLAGPAGRPAIYGSSTTQAQIRYTYLRPEESSLHPKEISGFYGNISIEMPGADVNLPSTTNYSTFSRYPDFVTTIRYQVAEIVGTTDKNKIAFEHWHVQLGAVLRDLGVEGNAVNVSPVRETTTAWGTQLSGQFNMLPRQPAGDPNDSVLFSITVGQGMGHYFPDLHNVSAVNDAAYDATTSTLTPLPLFAYFVGYQHDWSTLLRSTFVYSRIDLNSVAIPGSTTPYRRGDYMSINLVLHKEGPTDAKASSYSTQCLLGGLEYLYGQRENLAGNWGANQRILLFIAASK